MDFNPSDIWFLVVVLWMAVMIISNGVDGGGGRRGRLPSACSVQLLSGAGSPHWARRPRWVAALRREYRTRTDLDSITMLEWLREKRQTPAAIERFWRQVLVSAINEELDRMAAIHGFQVFGLGFLSRSNGYEMGVPAVP